MNHRAINSGKNEVSKRYFTIAQSKEENTRTLEARRFLIENCYCCSPYKPFNVSANARNMNQEFEQCDDIRDGITVEQSLLHQKYCKYAFSFRCAISLYRFRMKASSRRTFVKYYFSLSSSCILPFDGLYFLKFFSCHFHVLYHLIVLTSSSSCFVIVMFCTIWWS